jgi:hypothetical protein
MECFHATDTPLLVHDIFEFEVYENIKYRCGLCS